MRKFVLPAAIAAATAVGTVGIAFAADVEQGLKVTVAPSKAGTAAKPKAITLKVSTPAKPSPTAAPYATTKAVITFDKNIKFNTSKFKFCSEAIISAQGDSGCPAGSKVGTGTAVAQGVGTDTATGAPLNVGGRENLKITIFNGKNNGLFLHLVGTAPLPINATMIGSLKGRVLTVNIPENLQTPIKSAAGNVFAELYEFNTTVKATYKKVPYVTLVGCTARKLTTKGTFYYTDKTSKTVSTTTACSK